MSERPDVVAPLDERTARLVRLSAALAVGGERLSAALDAAASDADPAEAEEVLLQGYLFVGFPAVLRALGEWRRRVPAAAAASTEEDPATWRERGERVCARIYAGAYGALRENVRALHPDIERWMLEEGYGKVLGRPGLPLRERELCIVGLLAGLEAPHQLHSHMRGALNVGAAPDQVVAALEVAGGVLPAHRVKAAEAVWHAVLERWRERQGGGGRVGGYRAPLENVTSQDKA